MHILIINPNTTAAMTAEIGAIAKDFASMGTAITALNPANGPASIQGSEDGEAALPGLFALFDAAMAGPTPYDAVIIACFDDTGLQALKARSSVPVIGIGEAAFHLASLLGKPFSTVTTLSISIPVIESNIIDYGFAKNSARVRASEVPVLAIGDDTAMAIMAEARSAIAQDGCKSIVLGCAGMAALAHKMTAELGVPVIDGVIAAIGLCETLYRIKNTA